ncbi:cytochrome P450 [Rhodococcus sp. IEGM 1379]|uniref:cytochrome P450/oxidoreductase n=1 Tax=Rhodococcus sp. IEGM 1379 TaxID=3047086 RepID=UPI0024B79C33|nr:cytochrome P450 [Rhodococcus sp. IEGM 1379]MDI9918145.1 cytochrome P450 [Rhodococcus sp. IEGM 1379]
MTTHFANSPFDHHSDECNADPVAYYRDRRSTCPVGWTDAHEGYWYTSRWSDVVKIARDDKTFSSERQNPGDGISFVIPRGVGLPQFPIELDPPKSVAYRDLVNPLLTPDAVELLKPMIAEQTTRIIDKFIESGSCDLVDDLTNPLPTAVTLAWLGFPEEDGPRLAGPVHDIFAAPAGSERSMRGVEGLGYLEQRIRELLAARREAPARDVLTYLVTATHPEGRPFTDDELVSVTYLLVAGGVDTTTSLTGSTLVWMARNPDEREKLVNQPELLEQATEEFLRVFAPSQSMARTATADTEVDGCPVRAGERVLMSWVAANHDPEVFEEPETVQLDRDARRHLSFGIGSHRCPGAHLARAMFTEMTTQVLTRLPDYRIDESALVPYPTLGNQAGWDRVPATFTPGTTSESTRGRTVRVEAVRRIADEVVELTLEDVSGLPLPSWAPGANLPITLPSGTRRQYSLCGDPGDSQKYRIAVLLDPRGRGGSLEVHEHVVEGCTMKVDLPRNNFKLEPALDYIFIAGGIGVTPMIPMVKAALAQGSSVSMVYSGRGRALMAYVDELTELLGDSLTVVDTTISGRVDMATWVSGRGAATLVYCCGPTTMMDCVEQYCAAAGSLSRFRREHFAATPGRSSDSDDHPFSVTLARSGVTINVAADQTLLDAIAEEVPGISRDCLDGYCGACETRVLAGKPLHRDSILTQQERAQNRSMFVCVGRAQASGLVLDV